MTSRSLSAGMFGVLTLLAASFAAAQPDERGDMGAGMGMGMGMGGGRGFRPEMIAVIGAELGVADSVLGQIKDKSYKSDQEAIKLRADLDSARLEMRRLMDEDKPDPAKVMKQIDAVGNLETELKKNRVRLLLSVRELLTPDQRKKLQKVMAERIGAGRRMRGGFPGDEQGEGGPGFGPPNRRGPGGRW
ncbi:MAG: periplasmic heavy metal sensor [Deltaproteobacteria bacterium]|nr:periplasmic heavy metal sensor [Deltaproteobacteria bacterium]